MSTPLPPNNYPAGVAGGPVTIWTKSYFISLAERVLATFLVVLIAALTKNAIDYGGEDAVNIWRLDWSDALLVSAGAAVLSLLKGVLANVSTKDGPSLTHSEQVVPPLPAPAEA